MHPRPSSALEYWFFKVNAGPVAILVDWIVRREDGEHWLRVSIHSPHRREVLFEKQTGFMTGGNTLDTQRTAGQTGKVAWELAIDISDKWIKPDIFPAGLVRMSDLMLESALAKFTGWIRHGDEKFMVTDAAGMVSHYWGRQLAAEWWWVSANQFDQPGVSVECAVLRSSLWGTSMHMPLGYLYLKEPGKSELTMAPLGLGSVTGTPEHFEITIRRIGATPITLIATGRGYGDFDDGIVNTLVGDLEIMEGKRLIAIARGTAALERRTPGVK